jgi:hypothetical protein
MEVFARGNEIVNNENLTTFQLVFCMRAPLFFPFFVFIKSQDQPYVLNFGRDFKLRLTAWTRKVHRYQLVFCRKFQRLSFKIMDAFGAAVGAIGAHRKIKGHFVPGDIYVYGFIKS